MNKYRKNCVKGPPSKRPKIVFQDQLLLNAGQKYCRMLQGEHSAILLTFIKLPFVIKIFVLSIFEWPFYTGFTDRKTVNKRYHLRTSLFADHWYPLVYNLLTSIYLAGLVPRPSLDMLILLGDLSARLLILDCRQSWDSPLECLKEQN